jgi:hypothetical protein
MILKKVQSFEKWHEAKVLDKVDVDKSIHVMYVNQSGTIVVGSENLSEEPLHCLELSEGFN